MKTKLSKVLACALALALFFTSLGLYAFAREASGYNALNLLNLDAETWAKRDEQIYPTIILPGISQSYSYLADGNGDVVKNADGQDLAGGLMIIDSTKVASTLTQTLLPAVLYSLASQKPGKIQQAAEKAISEILSIQATDNNGNPVNNLQTEYYPYPLSEMSESRREQFYKEAPAESFIKEIGEENIYFFAYPLIGDPMEAGKRLHEYIQLVKAQRGVDKVNLLTLSLGGTVLTAYMDLNMADDGVQMNPSDINRVINAVSLLDGTEIMSDFFSRNFNLSDQFVFQEFFPIILKELAGDEMIGNLVNVLIHALPRAAFEQTLTGMVDGMLETMILHNPQFWAMVESKEYDTLAARYLSDAKYSVLRAKTDRFQKARLNLKENLINLADNYEAYTFNLCAYNLQFDSGAYSFFAIMNSSGGTNSDAVIQLASTSMGATYAVAGQTLSAEYLASADSKYISPDKGVDASTCVFPDHTWFIKDQHHEAAGNDAALEMMLYIAVGAIDDIYSDPENYPQFNLGRNTRNLTRNLIPKAEDILNNSADYPNATAASLTALEQALDATIDMLLISNIYDAANCIEVETALQNAINTAVSGTKAQPDYLMQFLSRFVKFLDKLIYKLFGAKGFFD